MSETNSPRELHSWRLFGYSMGFFGIFLTNILISVFAFQFYVYTVNLDAFLTSAGISVNLIIVAVIVIALIVAVFLFSDKIDLSDSTADMSNIFSNEPEEPPVASPNWNSLRMMREPAWPFDWADQGNNKGRYIRWFFRP